MLDPKVESGLVTGAALRSPTGGWLGMKGSAQLCAGKRWQEAVHSKRYGSESPTTRDSQLWSKAVAHSASPMSPHI